MYDTVTEIGIYVGSFDPFHKGHLEAILQSMPMVDKIYVLPNAPRAGKPFRSNLNDRYQMVKQALDAGITDIEVRIRVTVSDMPADMVIQELRDGKSQRIYGIIGSDCALQGEPTKMKMDQWLVIPRGGYPITDADVVSWSVPATILPQASFSEQNSSSTQIRRQIRIKDLSQAASALVGGTSNYCIMNDLYNPRHIGQLLTAKEDVETISLKGDGTVVLVKTGDFMAVLKIYPNSVEVEKELFGNASLHSLKILVPKGLVVIDAQVVVFTYQGLSIKSALFFGSITARQAGIHLGTALKAIHSSSKPITVKFSDLHLDSFRKLTKLITRFPPAASPLTQAFLDSNEVLTPTHGDASVNNFTIKNGSVYAIDTGGFEHTGIPCYDYYQCLSSIRFYSMEHPDEVQSGFISGYGTHSFTREAISLCEAYWNFHL